MNVSASLEYEHDLRGMLPALRAESSAPRPAKGKRQSGRENLETTSEVVCGSIPGASATTERHRPIILRLHHELAALAVCASGTRQRHSVNRTREFEPSDRPAFAAQPVRNHFPILHAPEIAAAQGFFEEEVCSKQALILLLRFPVRDFGSRSSRAGQSIPGPLQESVLGMTTTCFAGCSHSCQSHSGETNQRRRK